MNTTTFNDFGLAADLLRGLEKAGFATPTPIQAQSIAPQIAGRDILGIAQTGTGKTAAFGLPILHHILALPGRAAPKTTRALILAPTRELAVQIREHLQTFADGARLTTQLVLGGTSRAAQIRGLARGVDVVVATPGRLTDLLRDRHLRLDQTRWVVLDEADRMLDMGFVREVRAIIGQLHPRRQSALFSATMPAEVAGLANSLLNDPVRVEVARQGEPVGSVNQRIEMLAAGAKRARLAEILSGPECQRVIVFARTKRGADRVARNLEKDGVPADAIHGNKAQNARQRALDAFRSGRVKVLVATDIAARGIDVPGISHVINHDLPDDAENYVHRIGRTGRNGSDGVAITLCAPEEHEKLRAVEKLTRARLAPGGADAPGTAAEGSKRRPPRRANGAAAHAEPANSAETPGNGGPRRRRRRRGARSARHGQQVVA